MRRRVLLLILASSLVLSACGAQEPKPDPTTAKWDSAKWDNATWER